MIQNIKVDTIYYLTNSDFEMEFNLCGCCKMRLLTDKAENAKNFIELLSRAVSRSQVIICCGKLFDDNGLIKIVSQAIKKPLYTVNNEDFGIADDSEINIIEGSLPLVNSDGCFCGCIAESGPQSIILLTENKSIRKTVMKELIHPYIEELSIIQPAENPQENLQEETEAETDEVLENEESAEEVSEEVLEESEETPTSDDETQEDIIDGETVGEETLEETAEIAEEAEDAPLSEDFENGASSNEAVDTPAHEEEKNENSAASDTNQEVVNDENTAENPTLPLMDVVLDEEEETEPEIFMDAVEINSGFELYLEPERVKFSKKSHYELNYVPSEKDGEFISESSDDEFFEESRGKVMSLPILIISIILLVALAALVYLLVFVPMASDYTFSEYIRNIFSVSVNFPLNPF